MYKFKVVQADDVLNEKFESALHCARECIESVMDDEGLKIKVENNYIILAPINSNEPINITLAECKEKVKSCFSDKEGIIYPEFKVVNPE